MIDQFLTYVLTAASVASQAPSPAPEAPAVAEVKGAAPGETEDRPVAPPGHSSERHPAWARPALGLVLLLAAGLYLWGLARNGMANQYYAAAVLSMTQNWSNFFFGSFDPGGFITVDKPPFAFWVQAISARLFGLNSWSILVPQGIAGVASVLVVHHLVTRVFCHVAGLIAALTLALTPVTVAVNRDNLPDGMLVLLLVLAAWAVLNGIGSPRLRPLLISALLVGLAFNTKMLQAYLVIPAFGLSYLIAGLGSFRHRIGSLLAAGLVLVVVSASWMVVVDAIPPDARPFIGGSSNNTVLDLVMGYNGLGRIYGNEFGRGGGPDGGPPSGAPEFSGPGNTGAAAINGPVPGSGGPVAGGPGSTDGGPGVDGRGPGNGGPGGGGGPNFGGQPGWLRLFNDQNGAQIGWLLPLAALALVVGLVGRRQAVRSDPARAFFLLWGGWLVTHFVVFSLARGIFHPYYSTAMAPAVAALVGAGLVTLWGWYRQGGLAALALPAVLGIGAAWPLALVSRSSWGEPWLPIAIAGGIGLAAVGLLAVQLGHRFRGEVLLRPLAVPALALAILAILIGPGLWSLTTLEAGQSGVTPAAGPTGSFAGPGGGGGGFAPGQGAPGFGGATPGNGQRGFRGADGPGLAPPPGGEDRFPAAGNGGLPEDDAMVPPPSGGPGSELGDGQDDTTRFGPRDGGPGGGFGPGRGPDGPGGVSQQMEQYLMANQGSARFLLATTGSMGAAPVIIATGKAVIAMGGFSGSDSAPTAEALQKLVQSGELRFILLGGGGPGGFGPGGENQRTEWVRTACALVDPTLYGAATAASNGGQLYDCTGASSAGAL